MNHIDPSTRLFPLYDEKVLRGQANKIAWCPTTDLAVIAFQDHVALYRGGVTKIWSMAIPEYTTITSLVWKPNGKEFAMGCGDGTVYKVAVSWAEPRSVVCWPPTKNAQAAAITCLLWVPYTREKTVNANNTFDPLTGRLVSAIPALSMVPPDEPAPLLPRRTKKTPLPHEPTNDGEEQTLLLIGDANGHLYLSLNGIYHIGTVPLLQNAAVRRIDVLGDMDAIQVLVDTTEIDSEQRFYVMIVDSSMLQERMAELCNIATAQIHIDFLLRYMDHCAAIMEKHHEAYTKSAHKHAENVSNVFRDFNERTDPLPGIEILGLLASGTPSEAVHEYFANYLSEQQVKQWETKSNTSYAAVQTIVCEYLLPACERLFLYLSVLVNYNHWTERYGDLLDKKLAEESISQISYYMSRLHKFLSAVLRQQKMFHETMLWFLSVIQRFSNSPDTQPSADTPVITDHPRYAVEYLKTCFTKDSLNHFIQTETIPEGEERSIPTLRSMLQTSTDTCHGLLHQPSRVISENTKVSQQWVLFSSKDGISITHCKLGRLMASHIVQTAAEGYCYYALLQSEENERQTVLLLRNVITKHTVPHVDYCRLDLGHAAITDMEFFDDTDLGVVIQSTNYEGEIECVLGAIPYQSFNYLPFSDHAQTLGMETFVFEKALPLPHMMDVALGANGRPRRRLIAVIANNGKIMVLEMDPEEDEEEQDDIDEDHQSLHDESIMDTD